jgi:hypothetical protein
MFIENKLIVHFDTYEQMEALTKIVKEMNVKYEIEKEEEEIGFDDLLDGNPVNRSWDDALTGEEVRRLTYEKIAKRWEELSLQKK